MAQMRIVESTFNFGQIVYLKTDSDQKPRIVVEMLQRADGSSMYLLSAGTDSKWCYECEISAEKDVLIMSNG